MTSAPRSDDPEFSVNHVRGYADVGIREIICTGPADLPWPHPATHWDSGAPAFRNSSLDEMLAGAEAVIDSVDGNADGRILVDLTPFAIMPSVEPPNLLTPEFATGITADDRVRKAGPRDGAQAQGADPLGCARRHGAHGMAGQGECHPRHRRALAALHRPVA